MQEMNSIFTYFGSSGRENYFRRSFTEERLYVPIPCSFHSVTRTTRLPI